MACFNRPTVSFVTRTQFFAARRYGLNSFGLKSLGFFKFWFALQIAARIADVCAQAASPRPWAIWINSRSVSGPGFTPIIPARR